MAKTGVAGVDVRHGSAEVAGGRLHYRQAGAGPAVVLLHGWPATSDLWSPIVPALARSHTVVAVDLPGMGESDPPLDGDYRKAASADRVAALMTRLGRERYGVVGHDLGAMVAYALAARHPAAVERLEQTPPARNRAGGVICSISQRARPCGASHGERRMV